MDDNNLDITSPSLLSPSPLVQAQSQQQSSMYGAPLSQEAYDSFVARTGVPLAPEAAKSLLPLLQKRKADMIQEDLANSAEPVHKSLSKLDVFLHGSEDAMKHAYTQQKAEEEGRLARWKSFNNAASQFAGIDPKTALNFHKEERRAAEAAHKNDITEQYHKGLQNTRDVLANGKIDFWNKQGAHLASQDQETALHHRNLESQAQWTRESINSLEQDKLKLDKYKAEIYGGKASQDTQFRAKQLQDQMTAKLQAVNAGITKFNVARQFELSKVNPKTGKPLYMDESGNIPAYTPIPVIAPQAEPEETESAPLTPFPEAPQLGGAPASPQGLSAAPAQAMPPQGQPTSIGAMPTNMVPNLPIGSTTPPPPIVKNNPVPSGAQRKAEGATNQISRLRKPQASSVEISPQAKTIAQKARELSAKNPHLTPAQAVQQVLSGTQ